MFYQLAIWYLRIAKPFIYFNNAVAKYALLKTVDRYHQEQAERIIVS